MSELSAAQIESIARALCAGAVAVFATDTVYGIGTGAFCESSIQKIYTIKKRPLSMPLQILVGSVAQACQIAHMPPAVQRVACRYWPGALTLILKPSALGKRLLRGFSALGIRVPGHEVLTRLLAACTMPLASTSANVHGQPVLTQQEAVVETFAGQVDYILTDGVLPATASSVLDVTASTPRLLREGSILKTDLQQVLGIPIN